MLPVYILGVHSKMDDTGVSLRLNRFDYLFFSQEEPLPYELRTLPTLTLTMTYLLSQIADRGEDGKWGDWFDFLWNRTRGIRKV